MITTLDSRTARHVNPQPQWEAECAKCDTLFHPIDDEPSCDECLFEELAPSCGWCEEVAVDNPGEWCAICTGELIS